MLNTTDDDTFAPQPKCPHNIDRIAVLPQPSSTKNHATCYFNEKLSRHYNLEQHFLYLLSSVCHGSFTYYDGIQFLLLGSVPYVLFHLNCNLSPVYISFGPGNTIKRPFQVNRKYKCRMDEHESPNPAHQRLTQSTTLHSPTMHSILSKATP